MSRYPVSNPATDHLQPTVKVQDTSLVCSLLPDNNITNFFVEVYRNRSVVGVTSVLIRLEDPTKTFVSHGHLIIIIIIIIIFIYCNLVVTRWQWLFYMYTKHELGYY